MKDAALVDAFERTWPATAYADAGGFRIGRGMGAGRRVGSARTLGDWSEAGIDAAIAVHRRWEQLPLFRVLDDETALIAALEARGYRGATETAILGTDPARLTGRDIPQVTAFAIWPPLAIQREIWRAAGIGAARQAVMDRAPQPKTALLGRTSDRAAGAGFVALHGDIAMVHALEILSDWRRRGLAGWMMRRAAEWAVEQGAATLGLAVTRANAPALGLYRDLGFRELAGYAYYAPS